MLDSVRQREGDHAHDLRSIHRRRRLDALAALIAASGLAAVVEVVVLVFLKGPPTMMPDNSQEGVVVFVAAMPLGVLCGLLGVGRAGWFAAAAGFAAAGAVVGVVMPEVVYIGGGGGLEPLQRAWQMLPMGLVAVFVIPTYAVGAVIGCWLRGGRRPLMDAGLR